MPKGRHLKPQFFTDKHIVGMTPLARLLYQGLWCYAEDCGHLDDEPVELKMRILPADNCDVDELLDELVWHKRIERKDGVIFVPKLRDHARVDKRYETACEVCKEAQKHAVTTPGKGSPKGSNTAGSRSDHDVTTQGSQSDHDADGDGDGDGDGEVMVKAARKKPAVHLPNDWQPTPEHKERATQDGIDLLGQVARFKAHAEANDRRQVNWNAAFTQWLLNVPQWQRGQRQLAAVTSPDELPPVEDSWMRAKS